MNESEFAALREQVGQLREGRAAHAEKIEAVATRVDSIAKDVTTILAYMQGAKGSWRTLVVIGGVATALVEGIHQFIGFMHK
jgi:hypothetical protein